MPQETHNEDPKKICRPQDGRQPIDCHGESKGAFRGVFSVDVEVETLVGWVIWVFPKIGVFPPKWMVKIMENPMKMDDLGVPLVMESHITCAVSVDECYFFITKNCNYPTDCSSDVIWCCLEDHPS